jgi:phosphomannomutase/phosphoglucomutase
LTADLPSTAVTPEIRVDCEDHLKFNIVAQVKERFQALARSKQPHNGLPSGIRELVTIDGIRIVFEDGWGLIRASNTQPALVLRFEASTPDQLKAIRSFVETELAQIQRSVLS